jgi:hypothetical protein
MAMILFISVGCARYIRHQAETKIRVFSIPGFQIDTILAVLSVKM